MSFTVAQLSGPPGSATLISPAGSIATHTPTSQWNAVPSSTWYYLWVDDSTGNRIQQWYTAAACWLWYRHGHLLSDANDGAQLRSGLVVDTDLERCRVWTLERLDVVYGSLTQTQLNSL